MFKIVIFDKETAIEGVPSKWIKEISKELYCFWPLKMKRDKVAKLIKGCADHSSSWTLLKCRIKCEAASYDEMVIKAKEAEIVSSQAEVSDEDSECADEDSDLDERCETPSPPRKKKKG